MNNDPIIQELRVIRKNIEDECQRKGQTYFERLLEVQDKFIDKIVEGKIDPQVKKKSIA
jgi:CRISPR/Cas system CSM-associated protein Csm2 small subunit